MAQEPESYNLNLVRRTEWQLSGVESEAMDSLIYT